MSDVVTILLGAVTLVLAGLAAVGWWLKGAASVRDPGEGAGDPVDAPRWRIVLGEPRLSWLWLLLLGIAAFELADSVGIEVSVPTMLVVTVGLGVAVAAVATVWEARRRGRLDRGFWRRWALENAGYVAGIVVGALLLSWWNRIGGVS
ncbi:hypothetical protein [Demequina salsinemoris]|uniref:hypothetical protein n=1 Tax=Demequina salsinemoris TaxID=577470 RepID=UPI00078118B7|nr:hypothetical protein [Demequina salsinemoris]